MPKVVRRKTADPVAEVPQEPTPIVDEPLPGDEADHDFLETLANEAITEANEAPADLVAPATTESLVEEFEALRARAERAGIPIEDVTGVTGMKHPHERDYDALRSDVHATATRQGLGASAQEVRARRLDRSAVNAISDNGRTFLRGHHLKWVNRSIMDGARVLEHQGNGFFTVRPSRWAKHLQPVCAVRLDDTWVLKDLLLMAETMENYRNHLAAEEYTRSLREGDEWRESVKDQINRAYRESPGSKPHQNVAFDKLVVGDEIDGPNPKAMDA